MIDSKIKTFTNLKELGDFLKENRELQNIKIEDASKLLLIKKDILDKFEKGEVNIEQAAYLKGFLNSYIKFLKLENSCKLKLTETKKVSKLEKTKFSAEFGKQEVTHLLKVFAVDNQIMVKINW